MKYAIVLALTFGFCLTVAAQDDKIEKQKVETGLPGVELTQEESTAAISVITADQIGHRKTKNIGNSIIGQGLGLISLQGAGNVSDMNPTFYVRGLQTLNSNNAPLILVDGIERSINNVSAEEIESVSILKDAAALALYGYKAVNGAILLTTKRGEKDTRVIKFTYDHMFNSLLNKPQFVDGLTYALATKTWTGNAQSITFKNTGTSQWRIVSMTITYEGTAANIAGNVLKGTKEDTEAAGKYILAMPEGEPVGFYLAETGKIKAGKAYLEVPEGTDVKAFYFSEDEATGIDSLTPALSEGEGAIYNIAGQRLQKMQRGIYIVGGKKILK